MIPRVDALFHLSCRSQEVSTIIANDGRWQATSSYKPVDSYQARISVKASDYFICTALVVKHVNEYNR